MFLPYSFFKGIGCLNNVNVQYVPILPKTLTKLITFE